MKGVTKWRNILVCFPSKTEKLESFNNILLYALFLVSLVLIFTAFYIVMLLETCYISQLNRTFKECVGRCTNTWIRIVEHLQNEFFLNRPKKRKPCIKLSMPFQSYKVYVQQVKCEMDGEVRVLHLKTQS